MAESTEREWDIDLLLVTGAGASHEFGVNHTKLPLMRAWSDALVEKISGRSFSYLEATGLEKDLDGPEFEERLGRFLRMAQALPNIEQVLKPSLAFQPPPANFSEQAMRDWHRVTIHHVGEITDLIHESLYESFSAERIDLDAAAQAYGMLFQQLGVGGTRSMVYATTNYDVVGEYVIGRLGGLPDWGEPHALAPRGEADLRVERLLDGMPRYVPVLHLHGRVGWYRRDSQRPVSGDTTKHHKDYGVPIVMLPDPNKEYDADPLVFSLWSQFEEALQRARRVFVLGHSLNDRQLVQALRENVMPAERVAVTVLGDPESPGQAALEAQGVKELLERELPTATLVPICFAQNTVSIEGSVERWNDQMSSAGGTRLVVTESAAVADTHPSSGFLASAPGPDPEALASPAINDLRELLKVVDQHIALIFHHRMVWQATRNMLRENPNFPANPPYLFGVLTELYSTSQAAAIRREAEGRGLRDRNMRRLLHELRLAAPTISRTWFCALYPNNPIVQSVAYKTFEHFSLGGETLSVDWVDFAAAWLKEVSRGIREYMDKRIAHPDYEAPIEIPTFDDLDAAIEALGEVDRQLHLLLLAADYMGPTPVLQFNWAAGLEVAWYVPTTTLGAHGP